MYPGQHRSHHQEDHTDQNSVNQYLCAKNCKCLYSSLTQPAGEKGRVEGEGGGGRGRGRVRGEGVRGLPLILQRKEGPEGWKKVSL